MKKTIQEIKKHIEKVEKDNGISRDNFYLQVKEIIEEYDLIEKDANRYWELDIKKLFEIECDEKANNYNLFLEYFRDDRSTTFEVDGEWDDLSMVEGYINDKIFDNGLVWFADKVKEFEEDWSLEEVENENKGQ